MLETELDKAIRDLEKKATRRLKLAMNYENRDYKIARILNDYFSERTSLVKSYRISQIKRSANSFPRIF